MADLTDGITLKSALENIEFDYVVNRAGYIDYSLFFNGGRKAFDSHHIALAELIECQLP